LPKRNKQSWSSLYSKANPVALDLLSKMLVFNPNKRYTIKQCLAHPYFEGSLFLYKFNPMSGLHNEAAEPLADCPFDWSFDNFEPTKTILQDMVFEESLQFHPQ
jgi:mitogen-activated protein kinase 1/3